MGFSFFVLSFIFPRTGSCATIRRSLDMDSFSADQANRSRSCLASPPMYTNETRKRYLGLSNDFLKHCKDRTALIIVPSFSQVYDAVELDGRGENNYQHLRTGLEGSHVSDLQRTLSRYSPKLHLQLSELKC